MMQIGKTGFAHPVKVNSSQNRFGATQQQVSEVGAVLDHFDSADTPERRAIRGIVAMPIDEIARRIAYGTISDIAIGVRVLAAKLAQIQGRPPVEQLSPTMEKLMDTWLYLQKEGPFKNTDLGALYQPLLNAIKIVFDPKNAEITIGRMDYAQH